MNTPPFRSYICIPFFLLLSGLLFGCTGPRLTAGPEEKKPATTLSPDAQSILADSTADIPHEQPPPRVYHHLQQAFLDLQANQREEASLSLDRSAILLADLCVNNKENLSAEHRAGLVRVALELYRDLLPPEKPIAPESPLAYLLGVLPDSVLIPIGTHPYYQELYIRKLAGMSDVPVDYTPEVARSIRYFQTDAHSIFERWLSRSKIYAPLIQEALREAELPEDLVFKAMIESGFNPRAYSRAGAAGLWQFVGSTAPLYGLRRDVWVDERRDPEKSTQAAVRHIQHLYDLFEDWRLVVAAYNCGQGRLQRIIQKSGTRDFWKLKGLPRETRNHVPRFMASLLISKDPEWFGFKNVVYQPPLAYDLVAVSEWVDLRLAAECAGTSYEQMRMLNPELRMGYTPAPPVRSIYHLRVPAGTAERFETNYARLPEKRKVQMVDYRVRYGDTVSGIARKMGVNSQALMDANGIRNPRSLRAGKHLKVPVRPDHQARAMTRNSQQTAPDPDTHSRLSYTVRTGDTLWDIARKEGVSPDDLRAWNNLKKYGHIFPGNRLTIWKPSVLRVTQAEIDEPGVYYVVRPGDTLWEIAQEFQTSVQNLKEWNRIRRATSLRAGTRLRVRLQETLAE